MKLNNLQVKQFGRPMGKSDMQIPGLKLLFTSASSNISTMLFKVKDGGIIIKKVM